MSSLKAVALAAAFSVAVAATLVGVGSALNGGEDLVRARFASAAPLVEGNEVKVDGVVVGKVESLEVTDGVAEVSMQLDEKAMPLHDDARLTIRPVSLLGERYIDLDRGSPSAPVVSSGEVIPVERTRTSEGLDEVLNTVDQPTGEGLKALVTTLGEAMADNGGNVDKALQELAPSMRETEQLAAVLREHNLLLSRLIEDFEPVAGALATRDGKAMDKLIASSDTVLAAVQRRQRELDETLQRLPGTLRTLRSTLGNLRSTAADTAPTLAELRPLTNRLPAVSKELRQFSDALDPALASSEPMLRKVEQLLEQAAPVVSNTRRAGPGLAKTTDGVRRVAGELTAHRESLFNYVRYWALTTNGRDGLSHYFRVNASLNEANLTSLFPVAPEGQRGSGPQQEPDDSGGLLGGGGGGLLGGDGDGLLSGGGLLGGQRDADGRDSPTGLNKKQERELMGMLLGGR